MLEGWRDGGLREAEIKKFGDRRKKGLKGGLEQPRRKEIEGAVGTGRG